VAAELVLAVWVLVASAWVASAWVASVREVPVARGQERPP
jgi:hypothetical protein